jgi:glycosyltransferase involved in cell wall biosynthesis
MRENFRTFWSARFQSLPYLGFQTHALRSLIWSRGIQVVNSHWMVPQGLSAALALGTSSGIVNVLSVHAGDVYLLEQIPAGSHLARFIVRHADSVFAAGSQVRDSLDGLLGFASNAIMQPMGVDTALFGSAADVRPILTQFENGFILFVGRLVEKKGVTCLLKAMPRILAQRPGLGLIIVGSGPLKPKLQEETQQLGLEQIVRFEDRKGHSEIVRYLHGCRVLVIPSIVDTQGETEGMPTVLVEALAAGSRVVASDVAGIPDVLRHGQNGWIFKEKDPEDLSEKVVAALDDPEDSDIVKGALQTAARFDWAQVAENYLAVFERLLSEKKFTTK